jgi:transcription initiation factor TFIID TATA-box-binding protein
LSQVEIQNVVATATLGQEIDLLAIRRTFLNTEYRPKRFPGLVFRLKQPKTTTLIFNTGKMVCTGAKSEKMAMSAVRKVIRELRKADFIIRGMPRMSIVNMVATADVGGEVDLEAASEFLDSIMYEPEYFPGAIYRMAEPKVVILIFHSGKMVITGAKREEHAYEAAEKMRSILMENEFLY